MQSVSEQPARRSEIDGLRGIAVLAVIAFHYGFLPHGFLPIDVFFAISGYLITDISATKVGDGQFSFASFFLRRNRSIIPLRLLISAAALVLGVWTMRPDAFENVVRSVVATDVSTKTSSGRSPAGATGTPSTSSNR